MNFHPLHCHPSGQPPANLTIQAAVARTDSGLRLTYRIDAAFPELLIPAAIPSLFADGLWQHTCCEAFIATADGTAYREFNFSPSGAWAAYDFGDYRQRNLAWQPPCAPGVACRREGDALWLTAELPVELLPILPGRLGLTVVAETQDGAKSYWALAHAAAQPDFHLATSFTLPLP